MARNPRIVLPGMPHHITHRGNNREIIYFDDDDRRAYMKHLRTQSSKYGLRIEAYCLMTNHVHVVATPTKEESLAKTIGRTHHLYAVYSNHKRERSGHVWENRYYSAPMDGAHYLAGLRYVETNPVRAGLVQVPWEYDWSSAREHVNGLAMDSCLDTRRWEKYGSRKDWKKFICVQDPDEDDELRKATTTGYPLARANFLRRLEARLDRRMRAPEMGRPKEDQ